MSGSQELLRRVLGEPGGDAGCDGSMAVLDEYVEHELAGRPAAMLHPDLATHLVACPDCAEDRQALMDLVRRQRID